MSVEIVTPVGRIVGGHPLVPQPVTDDHGKPKMQADGVTQRTSTYVGLALPKNGTTDWRQTDWGAKIQAQAQTDWPRGEHQHPGFAWKITDGDSQVPNKKGKKPCEREGYPGHWVLNLSTEIGVKCYPAGKYDAMHQITDKAMIKPGDYVRVLVQVKGNASTQTAGVYLNPDKLELVQSGVEIQLDNSSSAADAFGGAGAAQLPPGAQVLTGTPAPAAGMAMPPPVAPAPATPPPPVAPNPAILQPPAEKSYMLNGVAYTESLLRTKGYTDAHFATMTPV